jgi:hypothetical protein
MKGPLALLKTCSSVCCCIMCMLTCVCEVVCYTETTMWKLQLELYMSCMTSLLRLRRDQRKQYLLDKFRTFQVCVTIVFKKKYKKHAFSVHTGICTRI